MNLLINIISLKYESRTVITFLVIQMIQGVGIMWLVLKSDLDLPILGDWQSSYTECRKEEGRTFFI